MLGLSLGLSLRGGASGGGAAPAAPSYKFNVATNSQYLSLAF